MELLAQSEMNLSVPDVPALAELLNCHPKEVNTHPHIFRVCPFLGNRKQEIYSKLVFYLESVILHLSVRYTEFVLHKLNSIGVEIARI